MSAFGVMLHHFFDDRHPKGQGAISAQDLRDLIASLGRENILSAKEWMDRALQGGLGSNDICLTFDDALRCQYDVAVPILKSFGLTGFWFVYSGVFHGNLEVLEIYRYFRTTEFSDIEAFYDDFSTRAHALYPEICEMAQAKFDPDSYLSAYPFYTRRDRIFRYLRDDVLGVLRYETVMNAMMRVKNFDAKAASARLWMCDDDLRSLHRDGHIIGLHSYTHPTRLCEMPLHVQAEEYRKNMDHLYATLGIAPIVMSHPCNSYTQDTISLLKDMGIRLGFRANMEGVENRSLFEFPREDHANIMKALRS